MIFISHKKEDEEKALVLGKYLKDENIKSYVDVLDQGIDSDNVTERIVENLRKTTHLIVIYSEHTEKSMWVPFELGVAYERDSGIGVLKWPDNEELGIVLPEYLKEFPVMNNSDSDVDQYIQLYKQSARGKFSESSDFFKAAPEKGYAQSFINNLKSSL